MFLFTIIAAAVSKIFKQKEVISYTRKDLFLKALCIFWRFCHVRIYKSINLIMRLITDVIVIHCHDTTIRTKWFVSKNRILDSYANKILKMLRSLHDFDYFNLYKFECIYVNFQWEFPFDKNWLMTWGNKIEYFTYKNYLNWLLDLETIFQRSSGL